jgi:hypothetical protein
MIIKLYWILWGINMVKTNKNKEQNGPPNILDQILSQTFLNLDKGDVFDMKTVSRFRELAKNGSFNDKPQLISILRDDLDEDTQTGN